MRWKGPRDTKGTIRIAHGKSNDCRCCARVEGMWRRVRWDGDHGKSPQSLYTHAIKTRVECVRKDGHGEPMELVKIGKAPCNLSGRYQCSVRRGQSAKEALHLSFALVKHVSHHLAHSQGVTGCPTLYCHLPAQAMTSRLIHAARGTLTHNIYVRVVRPPYLDLPL
jgi:hypothetical protein